LIHFYSLIVLCEGLSYSYAFFRDLQPMKRQVYFISDGTAITAETLGKSLLTQFEQVEFEFVTLPYINTPEQIVTTIELIESSHRDHGSLPIVIITIVDAKLRQQFKQCDAFIVDIFSAFLTPLEMELNTPSTHTTGKQRGIDHHQYADRIDAVHFAIDNDDGAITREYDQADIILVGVSRCGKTPTSLYLALQFGIKAANYPLTEEDFGNYKLPNVLKAHKDKLYGLTITPQRLQSIRQMRRADSQYASMNQCQREIREVETIFRTERIPYMDTTHASIEEISTRIMEAAGLRR
jgi:[pyruvate, water dikinase]-phosphate phosphotransferase / [pyruvate, water dikinase] kinase